MAQLVERFVRLASGPLLWLNILALVAFKFIVPIGSGGLAAITDPLRSIDTSVLLEQANAARQAASLRPLERNAVLDDAASRKLADMSAKGYFAHVGPDGTQAWSFISAAGYQYSVAGENLGRGFYDPVALMTAWLGSPSHRANILNTKYRHMGIAAGRVSVDGVSTLVVVQLFGAPVAVVAAPTVAPSPVPDTPPATIAPTPIPTMPTPVPATPRLAVEPMAVSTDRSIPVVQAPVVVPAVAGAESARTAKTASGFLAVELSAVLGLLTVGLAWMGTHRRLLAAWGANAALLAIAALVPVATRLSSGVIF